MDMSTIRRLLPVNEDFRKIVDISKNQFRAAWNRIKLKALGYEASHEKVPQSKIVVLCQINQSIRDSFIRCAASLLKRNALWIIEGFSTRT